MCHFLFQRPQRSHNEVYLLFQDMQKTPEKERSTSIQGDIYLSLTPPKVTREEQCGNCGLEMSLGHQ